MGQLTVPLHSEHKKSNFSCGNEMLDIYLQKQASQDVKRKLAACFVVTVAETNLVKGYYTLSNNSISLDIVPDEFKNKLPKAYKTIPTTLIGRFAIDSKYKGQGLGKLMLIDALKRAYEISILIGSFAIIVDPIDQNAKSFYEKYGFITLPDSGKIFLPMKTINQLFD
jgi:ribosomal protein S18 acetylase RimI-like enzyme